MYIVNIPFNWWHHTHYDVRLFEQFFITFRVCGPGRFVNLFALYLSIHSISVKSTQRQRHWRQHHLTISFICSLVAYNVEWPIHDVFFLFHFISYALSRHSFFMEKKTPAFPLLSIKSLIIAFAPRQYHILFGFIISLLCGFFFASFLVNDDMNLDRTGVTFYKLIACLWL